MRSFQTTSLFVEWGVAHDTKGSFQTTSLFVEWGVAHDTNMYHATPIVAQV